MTKPSFVYVTYIATTPQKAWQALIDPELTKRYWANHRNVSDWHVGSAWRMEDVDDASVVDIAGTVLESDPPRRLVVSWAFPEDVDVPAQCSRVTFELAVVADVVRLTVTHEDLEADSEMLGGVTFGWPAVLSSLKTLLETGQALPHAGRRGWPRMETPALSVQ